MSYHALGASPDPVTSPVTTVSPSARLVVSDTLPPGEFNPVTVTVGIPGWNAVIPLTSSNRIWLALGMSVVVGIVGGIGIAKLIKQAQK
jgi:hypothetical protein